MGDFYILLVASIGIVNLVNGIPTHKIDPPDCQIWVGIFLFIKLVLEDGFWSLDLRDRVVREKVGSGLVISSMHVPSVTRPECQNY